MCNHQSKSFMLVFHTTRRGGFAPNSSGAAKVIVYIYDLSVSECLTAS